MQKISIHAPRAGRDKRRRQSVNRPLQFQSTRPVRGATVIGVPIAALGVISIHAPRAGRDSTKRPDSTVTQNFNPRAPCGARRAGSTYMHWCVYFNPRAPCGARQARLPKEPD